MNYMEWKKRCISYFVSASVEVRATPVPDSFNLEIYDRLGQAINAAAIPTGAITLMLDVDCTIEQAVAACALALKNIGVNVDIDITSKAHSSIVKAVQTDLNLKDLNLDSTAGIDAVQSVSINLDTTITYVSKAGVAYLIDISLENISGEIDMSSKAELVSHLVITHINDAMLAEIDMTSQDLELIIMQAAQALAIEGALGFSTDIEMIGIDKMQFESNMDITFQATVHLVRIAYIVDYEETYVSQLGIISDTLYIEV